MDLNIYFFVFTSI